jgi:hypothetical protein
MFGGDYGGYGQFHIIVWIILAIAFAAGIIWRLRSRQDQEPAASGDEPGESSASNVRSR